MKGLFDVFMYGNTKDYIFIYKPMVNSRLNTIK